MVNSDRRLAGFIMGSRKPAEIAPGVHWYSAGAVAGNIYFVQSASSWVLIDTATAGQGRRIREAAAALFGAGARPAAILLTHVHPDHSGSALELARAWDCPVYLHPDELELAIARNLATVARYADPLDRGIILPVLRLFPRRWIEAMMERESLEEVVRTFAPEAAPPGLPEWTSITTPGHSPGHTAFLRRRRSRGDLGRRPADGRRWLAGGRVGVDLASQQAAGLRARARPSAGQRWRGGIEMFVPFIATLLAIA